MQRRPPDTPRSNELFFEIVARVRQAPPEGLTPRELAADLDLDADTIAQCIGLHLYLKGRASHALSLPLPEGHWVPGPDERVTVERLDFGGG